jgi:hypothetical protein
MNYRLVSMFVAALALSPLARSADEVTYSFECDTPAAHWSDWTRTLTGAVVRASGKITVNEMRSDERWMPAASVMIRGKQEGKAAVAGVSLSGSKQKPDRIFISINSPGQSESLNIGTVASTTTEFTYEVTLDAKGLLQVSLGDQKSSAQLKDFKPEKFALSCSTGDFEFTETRVVDSGK